MTSVVYGLKSLLKKKENTDKTGTWTTTQALVHGKSIKMGVNERDTQTIFIIKALSTTRLSICQYLILITTASSPKKRQRQR